MDIGHLGKGAPSRETLTLCAPTSGQHTVATARVDPVSSSRGTDMDMADGEMTRTEKTSAPLMTRPSSGFFTSMTISVYPPHRKGPRGERTTRSLAVRGPYDTTSSCFWLESRPLNLSLSVHTPCETHTNSIPYVPSP